MPVYENGPVRIRYEDHGSGTPLLIIPGGGLNSTIADCAARTRFDPVAEFSGDYRCVVADLRNADGGESSGPVEIDRPWDALTDDHLGLMNHLGIDRFLVMAFCIGGPLTWNLIRRAPGRVVAAALVHPSGFRPEMPDQFYQNNIKAWGPALVARRDDVTMEDVDAFLTSMYRNRGDFVFTVDRDFVAACRTPILILPDDVPAHPYAIAMETALLAPNAEVSLYPWKDVPERVPLALRHIATFLKANRF